MNNFNFDQKKIDDICLKHKAEFLGVFGSVARGDDVPESDIDMLVRFEPECKSGLFGLVRMQNDLETLLNKKVDLLTEGFLSKYFRDEVLSETVKIYGQT